ncbi:MAG: hypothetical protein KR126chlam1_00665 [Chlamydiae bacterium]|nr:hypothetical protein [Chlamydiota bacterium]
MVDQLDGKSLGPYFSLPMPSPRVHFFSPRWTEGATKVDYFVISTFDILRLVFQRNRLRMPPVQRMHVADQVPFHLKSRLQLLLYQVV